MVRWMIDDDDDIGEIRSKSILCYDCSVRREMGQFGPSSTDNHEDLLFRFVIVDSPPNERSFGWYSSLQDVSEGRAQPTLSALGVLPSVLSARASR